MQLQKIDTDELFDNSSGYDDETGIVFAPNLTDEERKQATIFYHLFNELMGICSVFGDPGAGKDLFGNYLQYKLKCYFPHKKNWRDEKPRHMFGMYDGLFNNTVIAETLTRMKDIIKGVPAINKREVMEKVADDWAGSTGSVMLKDSNLYITEFSKWMNNRDPMNPMNITMGSLFKIKRHLDMFVIGTGQLASELDKKTCLPWIDWRVNCYRSKVNKTGFYYHIWKVKYDRREDERRNNGGLVPIVSQPFTLSFDAGKPRYNLGDGKIALKKPYYQPQTEEERVVLEVLKAGVDTYELLVDILYNDGDMEENEVLETIKELKFRKEKRVVDYPCFFGLYNSKSAVSIDTRLKAEA